MPDRILSSRIIYEGWFNVRMLELELATGERIEREIVEHPSGAAVLPFDPERRVAMVITQARPPVLWLGESRMIEAIAGALDEDEPEECARREALEEGGLKLGTLEHVGRVWPTSATSTEHGDYYLAEYRQADRVAPGGGLDEEDEHIRVREMPLVELWDMALACTLRDGKTLALVQALRLRRPELFD